MTGAPEDRDGPIDQALAVIGQTLVIVFIIREAKNRYGSVRGIAVALIRLWFPH